MVTPTVRRRWTRSDGYADQHGAYDDCFPCSGFLPRPTDIAMAYYESSHFNNLLSCYDKSGIAAGTRGFDAVILRDRHVCVCVCCGSNQYTAVVASGSMCCWRECARRVSTACCQSRWTGWSRALTVAVCARAVPAPRQAGDRLRQTSLRRAGQLQSSARCWRPR